MKVFNIDGFDYKLPNELNDFQLRMYVHLINWKWANITREPGLYHGLQYDAILPAKCAEDLEVVYPPAREPLRQHLARFPFRIHTHFNHMASSQAANINLFLPVVTHLKVNAILRAIRPDFAELATDQFDNGYRIEFWDEPYGNLGDKTAMSGTDADIAIAYRNHEGQLCLWLIEHKLTEREFTACGGFKSRGRKAQHDCGRTFAELLREPSACYYHDVCEYNYWKITAANTDFFANHADHAACPFQGGMNQLWRNQLLALSMLQDERQPFDRASFSVVRHPGNEHLEQSLAAYRHLVADNPMFSVFTSADVLSAAAEIGDAGLAVWIEWYGRLYSV